MKQMKRKACLSTLLSVVLLGYGISAHSAEHTVTNKNKSFSVSKLSVKVGDTVHFKNEDLLSHSIFSQSEVATFDLGSYPRGQSRSHTFSKPGKVEVECGLHPDERLDIEVKP